LVKINCPLYFLQAATALHANATGLVTNDPIFKRVTELDVLLLDDCA
jgi:hypothetical protein